MTDTQINIKTIWIKLQNTNSKNFLDTASNLTHCPRVYVKWHCHGWGKLSPQAQIVFLSLNLGWEAFLPVIVQVSVEQVLQAVLQAVEHKLSMEIQATGSAVFWHRVRILQDSSEARQPVQQELKIFQLRTNKNSFSARKKKKITDTEHTVLFVKFWVSAQN